jgi:phospholipase/carboxylesterase
VPTENKTYTTYDRGWVLRVRPVAEPKTARVLIMIHGWTGDENSMWVFSRQIPDDYLILAPRGPVTVASGFGWAELVDGKSPSIHAYRDIADRLLQQIDLWVRAHKVAADAPLDLIGFSQGAAMCYAMLAQNPTGIGKVAGLSGFLPPETDNLLPPGHLNGKEIFIAHGTKDETIPLALAQKTITILEKAGAKIVYCEEGVGHKLGAACSRGLKDFFG